jgi:phage minor structural protein
MKAEVTEEANGMFELEIELHKGTQLNKRDIITAPTPRGVQPFRVYRITKTLQGIKAYARHIFYDLANALLLDVRPTNTNGNGALQAIINAVGWSGWTYISDIADLRTAYYVRKNPVEAIIGADNSILNVWGGNLIRDGREVRISADGVDRGYEIRLGKNLIGIEDDSDDSNVVTRLYPTFERNQVIYGIPEGYVDSPLVGNYPTPISKEVRVALTEEQQALTDAEIHNILRDYCNNLYAVDNVDKPVINYKVDFVQLAKIARIPQERKYTYAGLEQMTYETIQTLTYGELEGVTVIEQFIDIFEKVELYDTVKINVKELGIDLQAKVIKYTYDCLAEKYQTIELGGFKNSAKYQTSNIIQQIKNEREKASDEFRELYDLAINQVTGNNGGYVITRRNADNEPYEILVMDTPDIQTAEKVLRINQNGIAGSNNGYLGPYSVAITTDGYVVAERILANQLSAISANLGTIVAGRIQDSSGNSYWDLDADEFLLKNGVIEGSFVIGGEVRSGELDSGFYTTIKDGAINQQTPTGTEQSKNQLIPSSIAFERFISGTRRSRTYLDYESLLLLNNISGDFFIGKQPLSSQHTVGDLDQSENATFRFFLGTNKYVRLPNKSSIGKAHAQGVLDIAGDVFINNANIAEIGSNALGSWTKFYDGTMICRGVFSEEIACATAMANGGGFRSSSVYKDFPQPFTGRPVISCSLEEYGSNNSISAMVAPLPSDFLNKCFAQWRTITSDVARPRSVGYIAVGRWN